MTNTKSNLFKTIKYHSYQLFEHFEIQNISEMTIKGITIAGCKETLSKINNNFQA